MPTRTGMGIKQQLNKTPSACIFLCLSIMSSAKNMKVQWHIFLHLVHVFMHLLQHDVLASLFVHLCGDPAGGMIYWLDWGKHKKNIVFSRIWFTTWVQCRGQSEVKVEQGSLSSSTTEGVNGCFCRNASSSGIY